MFPFNEHDFHFNVRVIILNEMVNWSKLSSVSHSRAASSFPEDVIAEMKWPCNSVGEGDMMGRTQEEANCRR